MLSSSERHGKTLWSRHPQHSPGLQGRQPHLTVPPRASTCTLNSPPPPQGSVGCCPAAACLPLRGSKELQETTRPAAAARTLEPQGSGSSTSGPVADATLGEGADQAFVILREPPKGLDKHSPVRVTVAETTLSTRDDGLSSK